MKTDLEKRIAEALAGVTEGPWHGDDLQGIFAGPHPEHTHNIAGIYDGGQTYESCIANRDFIAAARSLLPVALSELRSLRERADELDRRRTEWRERFVHEAVCRDRLDDEIVRLRERAEAAERLADAVSKVVAPNGAISWLYGISEHDANHQVHDGVVAQVDRMAAALAAFRALAAPGDSK